MRSARLVSKATVGGERRYGWKEVQADPATGADVEVYGGYSGTTTVNYAIELNNADVDVTGSPEVWIVQRGEVLGQMVWEFAAPLLATTGGSTIVIEDADGLPSYPGIAKIQIPLSPLVGGSGGPFGISVVGSTADVFLYDATATQPGIVSTGSQTFGGDKTFANSVYVTLSAYAVSFEASSYVKVTDTGSGAIQMDALSASAYGPRIRYTRSLADLRLEMDEFTAATTYLVAWSTNVVGGAARPTRLSATSGFAVGNSSIGYTAGVTATLGPGAASTGGIITNGGSGTFVGTGANTFLDTQTINAGASVPALTLQQTASDASDTLRVRNAAGTTTFKVTGAGDVTANSFTGSGSGLTNIPAGQLTGIVDGGTW